MQMGTVTLIYPPLIVVTYFKTKLFQVNEILFFIFHQNDSDAYYSYSKAEQLFHEVDADESRNITIDEADQYLKNQSQYKRDTTFSLFDEIEKMDKNKDGIISPFEFDNSLRF